MELRRLAVRLMAAVASHEAHGELSTIRRVYAVARASGRRYRDRHAGVEQSDLELVRRAQRGERGAFDLLVLRYQHKVVKLVARLLRDPTEAEDVAQEAFVKAYRALASFRGDSAFYTWLYRIAVNTARNAMASRQRRPLDYEADLSETRADRPWRRA